MSKELKTGRESVQNGYSWITKKGGENSVKNSQKSQFSGFMPLKIILIMSFITLMQSGFFLGDIALELGPGTFILIMRLFL